MTTKTNYSLVNILFSGLLLALFTPGCSLFSGLTHPEENQTILTHAAETISVDKTLNAPTVTPTLTRTPRPPRPTDTPTPTFTTTPTLTPEVVLRDDFNEISGWSIKSTEGYSYGYANDKYSISVDTPFTTVWSTRHNEIADVHLQVSASQVSGPQNGFFGLICRQQVDGYNYYVFAINADGFYGIGKVVEGTLTFIQEGNDQSGSIQGADAPNLLSADCIGQTLTLSVNGQKLLDVEDKTFKTGFIGLVAGIQGMGGGLTAVFDDFFAGLP